MGTSLFAQRIALADTQPPPTADLCCIVCVCAADCSNRKGPFGITGFHKVQGLDRYLLKLKFKKSGWGCCSFSVVWVSRSTRLWMALLNPRCPQQSLRVATACRDVATLSRPQRSILISAITASSRPLAKGISPRWSWHGTSWPDERWVIYVL